MNSISSEFLLWRVKSLVCCSERSQSVPQCWAHHWMRKGKERKGHQQAIAWSIYSGCQISADISKELQSMLSASKSTAEGENPFDRPQATWPEVGPFERMSNSELLAHPGSLLRDHKPSFPSLSPDALTVVTKGQGCWHPLPGSRLSMKAAAMGGMEQPRLTRGNLQWFPYPEMAPDAAEAGLYWSNATDVPGTAQGVQQFKFY